MSLGFPFAHSLLVLSLDAHSLFVLNTDMAMAPTAVLEVLSLVNANAPKKIVTNTSAKITLKTCPVAMFARMDLPLKLRFMGGQTFSSTTIIVAHMHQ